MIVKVPILPRGPPLGEADDKCIIETLQLFILIKLHLDHGMGNPFSKTLIFVAMV